MKNIWFNVGEGYPTAICSATFFEKKKLFDNKPLTFYLIIEFGDIITMFTYIPYVIICSKSFIKESGHCLNFKFSWKGNVINSRNYLNKFTPKIRFLIIKSFIMDMSLEIIES